MNSKTSKTKKDDNKAKSKTPTNKGYKTNRDDPKYLRDLAEAELACMQEILHTLKDIQEELRGRRTWNDPSYQLPANPQKCPTWPPWASPWCPSQTPGTDRWLNNPDYTPSTTPHPPTDPYGNPVVYCKTFADGTTEYSTNTVPGCGRQ